MLTMKQRVVPGSLIINVVGDYNSDMMSLISEDLVAETVLKNNAISPSVDEPIKEDKPNLALATTE